jgi:hypothetical protein
MYTLNRTLIALMLVVMLINAFTAEFMPGRSSYSFRTDILDCDNLEPLKGCRHEIGHKMDGDLGMQSLTPEFAIATQAIVQTMMITAQPSEFGLFISVYPDPDPRELYAGLYARVNGDITKLPESLQPFFSTDKSYLELYDCLAQDGINLCGRSISFLN